jgi:hypothetical protein
MIILLLYIANWLFKIVIAAAITSVVQFELTRLFKTIQMYPI